MPACGGLGVEQHIDEDLVIPDKGSDLAQGRDRAVGKIVIALLHPDADRARQILQVHARHQMEGPAEENASSIAARLRRDEIKFSYEDGVRSSRRKKPFEASSPASNAASRDRANGRVKSWQIFLRHSLRGCTAIASSPESLCVKIGGKHIGEISELCRCFASANGFETVPKALNAQQNEIATRVLKEIRERLSFLLDVGLNYLTLARCLRH
jgi:excinuclease ABC subunit A